jgi:glyceraldehyde-3-phosphate dehydrogenase/erythrose-4-phosphate dehydrogenase
MQPVVPPILPVDNEFGYSCQMVKVAAMVAQSLQ